MRRPARQDENASLADLLATGMLIAPDVCDLLENRLGRDAASVREVATRLTDGQRRGVAALPDPLPVTPAQSEVYDPVIERLTGLERSILLIAAVSVVDRTDVLLEAASAGMDAIIGGDVARHLRLVSGRFAIADPRLRAVAHERADLGERTAAHAALARTHARRGQRLLSAWHSALSTLEGDETLAPPLIELARDALVAGDARWAFAVARESASHAIGADLARSLRLAGTAALHAGWVEDAAAWLSRSVDSDDDVEAARGLASYATAVTLSSGVVPEDEVLSFAADVEAGHGSDIQASIAAALDATAALFAERGDAGCAERMRKRASSHDPVGPGPFPVRPSAAWCDALLAGLPSTDSAAGDHGRMRRPMHVLPAANPGVESVADRCARAITEAVVLARSENFDAARVVLSRAARRFAPTGAFPSPGSRDAPPRPRATPLVEAHLVVAHALVDAWSGRFDAAATELADAAVRLPIGLPFAGAGVALARRLEVLMDLPASTTTEALSVATPALEREGEIVDGLIDAAIRRRRDGDLLGAASRLAIVSTRPSPGRAASFPLPEGDRVVVLARAGMLDRAEDELGRLHRADPDVFPFARLGLIARAELAMSTVSELPGRAVAAEAIAGRLPSPFDRAMTNRAVSEALYELDDARRARLAQVASLEHLRESGAAELDQAGDDRFDLDRAVTRRAPGTPIARLAQDTRDVAAEERAGEEPWARDLTTREREVAGLVIRGRSNREVAAALHVAVRTVEVHLGHVFAKTGVRSRTELSFLASRPSETVRRAVGDSST